MCQVGLAKVINGEIVESTNWLVIPPTGVDSFEPRFIGIHGITPDHVRHSGISWAESLQRIQLLAGDLPFVAHNASFDKTVYRMANAHIGVEANSAIWYDTLTIARRYVSTPNHKLPTVAKALNLPEFQHHEAEADAVTSALIALTLGTQHGLNSVHELWPTQKRSARSYPQYRFTRIADLPEPNASAPAEHPLFGHHVVITGDLTGYSRDDFIIMVAELGAQPQLNVTRKTTMLIVAEHPHLPSDYDPARGSGKEKKAHQYHAAGQHITFVGALQALEYLSVARS